MRIHPHTAMVLQPTRPVPVTHQTNSSATTQSATKPVFQPSAGPFGTLFQTLSGGTAGSSTSKTVSPTSIFGPSTSVNTTPKATAQTTPTPAVTASDSSSVAVQTPGIQTFVNAIMNGSFKATYVTDPSQLKETTPFGTDTMPNFYYASDATANQMASLLGGTVVQRPAFGQSIGSSEPMANFIQLPSGQTFNAADVAYYARTGSVGTNQLIADITQTINQGSAWANYYTSGGSMPSFPMGYVGPPIGGMSYPANMIGSDGNVINPAMQGIHT